MKQHPQNLSAKRDTSLGTYSCILCWPYQQPRVPRRPKRERRAANLRRSSASASLKVNVMAEWRASCSRSSARSYTPCERLISGRGPSVHLPRYLPLPADQAGAWFAPLPLRGTPAGLDSDHPTPRAVPAGWRIGARPVPNMRSGKRDGRPEQGRWSGSSLAARNSPILGSERLGHRRSPRQGRELCILGRAHRGAISASARVKGAWRCAAS
jgi:hypothetical protein